MRRFGRVKDLTKPAFFSLGICACCMFLACRDQGKIETENLTDVVLKYRGAPDVDKLARAEDIRRVACKSADVCAARDTCFDAASGYVRATTLTQEAKARYAKLESGALKKDDPSVQALPQMIDDAERTLSDSRQKMTACDAALEGLARAHHAVP